jgi:hypothetical protein
MAVQSRILERRPIMAAEIEDYDNKLVKSVLQDLTDPSGESQVVRWAYKATKGKYDTLVVTTKDLIGELTTPISKIELSVAQVLRALKWSEQHPGKSYTRHLRQAHLKSRGIYDDGKDGYRAVV